jgi:hypothetical protein
MARELRNSEFPSSNKRRSGIGGYDLLARRALLHAGLGLCDARRKENRMRTSLLFIVLSLGVGCGGGSANRTHPDAPGSPDDAAIDTPTSSNFSFFITSTGHPNGGDFRRSPADADGLAGADEFCQMKATAAVPASASRHWRAYLSTSTAAHP